MFGTVLKYWFTGKDNESYEILRALTALSVIVMLVYIGWHLIVNKTFDPMSAATGLGALLFGGGAGSAVKDGAFTKTNVVGDLNTEDISGGVTVKGDQNG